MSGPLCFLLEHDHTILTAYRQHNAKPRNAWISLQTQLPQLSRAMTFNTFKQYVSVFAFVKAALDKVRQQEVTQRTKQFESEKMQLEEKLNHAVRRLDKVRQNRDNLLKKLDETLKENARLKSEIRKSATGLDTVRQKEQARAPVTQKSDKKPKRISGWSVQHSKDGYYRCYRKIGNRVRSIYLGKELDVTEAENRIKAKEKSLGLI